MERKSGIKCVVNEGVITLDGVEYCPAFNISEHYINNKYKMTRNDEGITYSYYAFLCRNYWKRETFKMKQTYGFLTGFSLAMSSAPTPAQIELMSYIVIPYLCCSLNGKEVTIRSKLDGCFILRNEKYTTLAMHGLLAWVSEDYYLTHILRAI